MDPLLSHLAAAVLGALLISGALAKLRDLELFAHSVADYRLLPPGGERLVARTLPFAELAAGVLLLPTATRAAGALMALAVLAVVTGAVVINLRRGRNHIDCGCGGDGTPLSAGLVIRNALLAGAAAVAAWPIGARAATGLDYVALGAASLFLIGLYACANQLLSNQPRLEQLRNLP